MSYGGRWEAFFTIPSGSTIAATNSGGSGTSVSLTAGDYTPTSYCTHLAARLNAVRTPATWTVSLSTGSSGTGLVTIDCVGETWAITFTTAAAGTVIGFAGNISSTSDPSTGTKNARGLWLPKCPMNIAGDPRMGNRATDARSTMSPTGATVTYVNTSHYRHREIEYTHVPTARMREADLATYSSLEQWLDDTQFAEGHTWFSPGSPFQIYWDNNGTDQLVGGDMNSGAGPTNGWSFVPAVTALDDFVSNASSPRLAYWRVRVPTIVSEG